MYWLNFFHIYQPPDWPKKIIQKVVRESYQPLLEILKRNRRLKITLNISGSLTEQLVGGGQKRIIAQIKSLALKKQIELVGTAGYHPLLPLLSEEEIIRQIKLNNLINKKYFGPAYRPTGFFPPEMAYSGKVARAVAKTGFKWIILDEIAAQGKLGKINFNCGYRLKNNGLKIIFRNRILSDYLSFHSDLNHPQGFWEKAEEERNNWCLITAMDGENLGHHRPGLDNYWGKLISDPGLETVTASELLEKYPVWKKISPKKSSWASRPAELRKKIPYLLWADPTNQIHRHQKQLIDKTISLVNNNRRHPLYQKIRRLLDRRLASDQLWWASAKPWWSLKIIKKKTIELEKISRLLGGDKINEELAAAIIAEAEKWQRSGKFQKVAAAYLAAEKKDNVRFIGGKKISL